MGANPMQKMKRNSTLTGLIIGLLIGLVLCVFVYLFLAENSNNGEAVEAYVLAQDVSSGQIITGDMLCEVSVFNNMIPSNAMTADYLNTIQLQDKSGNILHSIGEKDNYEMYIKRSDYENYKTLEKNKDKVKNAVLVRIEAETGKFYITKIIKTTDGQIEQIEYIEFINVPTIAKINMKKNTVLTTDSITKGDSLKSDLRIQEYNMITLPTQLSAGDFIDIRLQLPNGGDYIVISKKQIIKCNANTVWLEMKEEEILTMSNAIVEYYIMAGSKLYATTYTDPGIQTASIPTYCPNSEVVALINGNKNITSHITDGEGRFTEALKNIRNNAINKELNKYSDNMLENIEKNIQEEIESLKESREAYFGELNSAY